MLEPLTLLRCPFCGGTPIQEESLASNGEPRYTVRCRSCACESGWGKTETAAHGWWNMRHLKQAVEPPTMEHYRCFHCKKVFGPDIAQDHFGKHATDLPKCIQHARNGSGGGLHDAYIRVRKDEFGKILATLDLAKGQMGGRHSDADLHAIVQAVMDEWRWFPRDPIKDPAL